MPGIESDRPPTQPPPKLWPSLLACGAGAAWIDLGTIHRLHHSDSILYVFISLWRWTPFYWGQDRIGMLVPLLAMPIRSPLANLLAQDFLNIFAGLASFVLLARYMLRDSSYAIVGTLCASAFVASVPRPFQAMYLIDACYGVWLVPGLLALIILEEKPGGTSRTSLLAAMALLVLTHWLNFAAAAILAPLVVGREIFFRTDWKNVRRLATSEPLIGLAMLAIGALAGRLLTRLSTAKVPTSLSGIEAQYWPDAWIGLARNVETSLSPPWLVAACLAAASAGILGMFTLPNLRQSATARRAAGALVIAAVAIWLYTGTRYWTKINGYTYRYMIPSVLFLELASFGLGFGPLVLASASRTRRIFFGFCVVSLLAGSWWTHGIPSISGVRDDLDRKFGDLTDDLIDGGCTHLAGDYDRVWSSIFHAAIVLHDRGDSRRIWGISLRADVTEPIWKAIPPDRVRLAAPLYDLSADRYLQQFRMPRFAILDRRKTLKIYKPLDRLDRPGDRRR